MSKRKVVIDGEQLLLELEDVRLRSAALEKLRAKEDDLRAKIRSLTDGLKDAKRQLKELVWDQRNLIVAGAGVLRRLSNVEVSTPDGRAAQ